MADEAPCGDQSDEVIFAKLKRFLVVVLGKSLGSKGFCTRVFRKYVLSSCGRFSGGPGTVKLPRTLGDLLEIAVPAACDDHSDEVVLRNFCCFWKDPARGFEETSMFQSPLEAESAEYMEHDGDEATVLLLCLLQHNFNPFN